MTTIKDIAKKIEDDVDKLLRLAITQGDDWYYHMNIIANRIKDSLKSQTVELCENDPVNHPAHYTDGKIEVIDFIEDKKLDFHLGSAVQYIARAGKKDPTKTVEDLKKAQWYLNRAIQNLTDDKS